jgi:hypothetical protein
VFLAKPFLLLSNSNFCSSENSMLLPCHAASRLNKRLTAHSVSKCVSYDLILNSPVPKKRPVQSQNLSRYDHKSTSPVLNSQLVLSHILSHYDPILISPIPKVTSFCPMICLIMTQYQLLLSQIVILFVPKFVLL